MASQQIIVELSWEALVRRGSDTIRSTHRHIGYVICEDERRIIISPELNVSNEGTSIKIGHQEIMEKGASPVFQVVELARLNEKTEMVEVEYAESAHYDGTIAGEIASNLGVSRMSLVGYLIDESGENLKMASALFDYVDSTQDFEIVHVIPKSSLVRREYLGPVTRPSRLP